MNFGLSFTNPLALLLFPLLAAYFWWLSRRTLADLSTFRRRLSLALRLILCALLVLSLAGAQLVRRNRDLAVMFVVDYSDSVGPKAREAATQYIDDAIKNRRAGDEWGVVVFGTDALIDLSPGTAPTLGKIRSVPPTEFTDISAAIRLAMASLPDGTQKRLVILSDGNENLGDAISEAQVARGNDVAVDVVPLSTPQTREVLLEKLTLPSEAKIGEPVELRVLARSTQDTPAQIKLFRNGRYLGAKSVQLSRGKNVLVFPQTITQPGAATFEATIETSRGADTVSENNRALGFVNVQGKPRVLLVGDDSDASKFLADALRREKVNVDVRGAGGLPAQLQGMQSYDAIILDNVPAWDLSGVQMLALQSYVRDLGGGLVMVGGENSYGPGGYRATPVEDTLPVTMDIRNMQYLPGGAVAMIMHSLEFANGNEQAKSICAQVTRQMGENDYAGLITFGMSANFVYPMLKVGPNRTRMLSDIRSINPGDMPSFDDALGVAYNGLVKTPSYLKHIIILSDGDPSPPVPALVNKMNAAKITVSTVAINPHDNSGYVNMQNIARQNGGRFYKVTNAKTLPNIFLKEAATVSRSAIIEGRFTPKLESESSIIKGIESVPQLFGYVGTSPKPVSDGSRVVLASKDGDPILATRQYGLGKSVAWTSDARQRWAAAWLSWSGYSKFWAQAVRWSMRQSSATDLQTNVDIDKGKGRVTVEAVDEKGNFRNFLNPKARLVTPKLKGLDLPLEQTAPGRYEASFDAREMGTYLVNIRTQRGDKTSSQLTGGALPYSPEYSQVGTDTFTLSQIAAQSGGDYDVKSGTIFERPRTVSRLPQDIWLPLLMLAACLFPFDVAARRLMWGEEEWRNFKARLRDRQPRGPRPPKTPPPRDESLGRLLKSKTRAAKPDDAAPPLDASTRETSTTPTAVPPNATASTRAPQTAPPRIETPPPPPAENAPEEDAADAMARLRRARNRARGEDEK